MYQISVFMETETQRPLVVEIKSAVFKANSFNIKGEVCTIEVFTPVFSTGICLHTKKYKHKCCFWLELLFVDVFDTFAGQVLLFYIIKI